MSKRKPKAAKKTCPHCGSSVAPVKGRHRNGRKCRVCPDCRGLITTE